VPSKDKVKDADITHLMAVGDVALRCNRLKVVATRLAKPESPVSDDKKSYTEDEYVYWFSVDEQAEVESAHA
jgi:hypothetical protein